MIDKPLDARGQISPDDRAELRSLLGQGVDGAIVDAGERVLGSDLERPAPEIVAAIARGGETGVRTAIAGSNIALALVPVRVGGKRIATAGAWEARTSYRNALAITMLALVIGGVCVVLAAASVAGLFARRMLQPVTELSGMLSDIEATDLTKRFRRAGPDDEIGRLCLTFDRLLDRLESAFVRERRFVADASHELRTPVTVMRAEIELALMHEADAALYGAALLRLQRETQRLEAMADRLLLTARLETSTVVPLSVDLAPIVARAADRMRPLARSRAIGLTLDARMGLFIRADATTLENAIVAVIDNAIRFSPDGGTVAISAARYAAVAQVRIDDSGPGFSADALREATGRFWRDDPARSGRGTGLGLSIVAAVVADCAGTLALENHAGHAGAGVTIVLPIVRAESAGADTIA